jgi:hypothetical protein
LVLAPHVTWKMPVSVGWLAPAALTTEEGLLEGGSMLDLSGCGLKPLNPVAGTTSRLSPLASTAVVVPKKA